MQEKKEGSLTRERNVCALHCQQLKYFPACLAFFSSAFSALQPARETGGLFSCQGLEDLGNILQYRDALTLAPA